MVVFAPLNFGPVNKRPSIKHNKESGFFPLKIVVTNYKRGGRSAAFKTGVEFAASVNQLCAGSEILFRRFIHFVLLNKDNYWNYIGQPCI